MLRSITPCMFLPFANISSAILVKFLPAADTSYAILGMFLPAADKSADCFVRYIVRDICVVVYNLHCL